MISSNHVTLVMFMCIVGLLVYRAAATADPTIEPFWGLPTLTSRTYAVNGQTQQDDNNLLQAQYYYSTNPTINQNMLYPGSVSNLQSAVQTVDQVTQKAMQPNLFSQIVAPPSSSTTQRVPSTMAPSTTKEPFCGSCSSTTTFPTYQVPGTQQSYLSPRQSSTGFSSYIKYNLPDEQNLALRPKDPLMMKESYCNPLSLASMVHPPASGSTTQEGFTSSSVTQSPSIVSEAVSPQYSKLWNTNKKESDTVVTSTLPIQTMATSIGNEPAFVNYDRYVFALQRDPLNGLGCPIRGDVPCTPCLPSQDPNSPTWFRPSSNPSTALRTGAINVIAGVTNVTSMQTAELVGRGTSKNTAGGVALPYPLSSPLSNTQLAQQAALESVNMGNSINQTVNYGSPYDTVTSTAFA